MNVNMFHIFSPTEDEDKTMMADGVITMAKNQTEKGIFTNYSSVYYLKIQSKKRVQLSGNKIDNAYLINLSSRDVKSILKQFNGGHKIQIDKVAEDNTKTLHMLISQSVVDITVSKNGQSDTCRISKNDLELFLSELKDYMYLTETKLIDLKAMVILRASR